MANWRNVQVAEFASKEEKIQKNSCLESLTISKSDKKVTI